MKKLLFLLAVTTVASLIAGTQNVRAASLNSFYISNYDMQMRLGRDNDGRSTLETTETITAQFSQENINHGLERAIPEDYNGHSVALDIKSVQDEVGRALEYSTYESGDNLVLRIGDPDAYVNGQQTYVIRYTQRDITRFFENTGKDEFYWDTNGTEWKVPIQKLIISLTVDESLRSKLTDDMTCYQGKQRSTDGCQLVQSEQGFSVSAQGLTAGENVTLAIGFAPETFIDYEMPLTEKIAAIWLVVQAVTFVAAIAVAIWLMIRFMRITDRGSELKPIPPEYIPPPNTSVIASANIAKKVTGSVMTAQLIDLAVRHYIKLYESKPKSLFRSAEYEIEVVKDISGLLAEEQEILQDMFGNLPTVSQRLSLKKLASSSSYAKRTMDNDKKLQDLVRGDYQLRFKDPAAKKTFMKSAKVLGLLALVTLSVPLLVEAIFAAILAHTAYTLTDKGLNLRRYLEGLKMYIGVAETERLKMLQSPDGAEKVARVVDGTDQKSLVKLYERVLPYAVLFGQEKEWSKSLGQYYEQAGAQPNWYSGQGVFNAAVFSSAMNGLSQAASYASSSSSSSGGSSGGGFSGGGGGGGGGGGW